MMKTDNADESMAELLETAAPDMSAGWQARAMDRLTAARPARGISRRLIITAVGLAALVGLGFVPIPMGKAPGALERAMAAMEQATTVHVTVWRLTSSRWTENGDDLTQEGEGIEDQWVSEDGFERWEYDEDGQLRYTSWADGPWVCSFSPPGTAHKSFDPTRLHPLPWPDRSDLHLRLAYLSFVAKLRGGPSPRVTISEHRESAAWGGSIDVVEAEWRVGDHDPPFCYGGPYEEGQRVVIRAEIDASTNRLLRLTESGYRDRSWKPTYEATYEWDVEIPEDVRQFRVPPGTEMTRSWWWESRANQEIAHADTRDWTVTLHAIDVKRSGEVVLSLSRVPNHVEADLDRRFQLWTGFPPFTVLAEGSGREQYIQEKGPQTQRRNIYNVRSFQVGTIGYWTAPLNPLRPGARPKTITLRIWPFPRSPCEDQSVTFRNIPLPPRQNTDDLFAAETEVIQY